MVIIAVIIIWITQIKIKENNCVIHEVRALGDKEIIDLRVRSL